MVRDITFKNFKLETSIPADSAIPTSLGNSFFVKDVINFTLRDFTAHNQINSLIHCWRSDNVLVENFTWTGTGRSKIFAPSSTWIGKLATVWGGTGITFQNITVSGQNLVLADTEVSPGALLFKNINFTMDYRKNYVYPSAAVLFGFNGPNFGISVENSSFRITADSPNTWHYDGGNLQTFKDLVFDDPVNLANYFHFPLYTIQGRVTFGSVPYGPFTSRTDTVARTASVNNNHIYPPKGFYKAVQFRVLNPGSCTVLGDGHGNTYNAALLSGAWTPVNSNWLQMSPYTSLALYQSQNTFHFNWSPVGGTPLTIEFQIDYYPAPNDVGWTTD
jgi:hypothetical protein